MNIYLQYIITGAAVAGLLGVAFAQFRKGNRNESGEIIEFYKKQAESYKEMMETTRKEYTDKHELLVKEVGQLRGELSAEKKLREQAELILKDKNPETQAFMTLVTNAVNDQGKINKQVVEILQEIHEYAQEEHERDIKITGTITKQ